MRIGATLGGIEQRLLQQLARSEAAAAANSLRLATGQKFNSPAEDPSGFLQVQLFQQQRQRTTSALSQIQAAGNVASQTQVTIDEIRTQLSTIRATLVTDESQALTGAERDAAQATIDAAISKIDSLASTQVEGVRVLDGSTDYTAAGLDHNQVRDLQAFSVRGTDITATVATTAQQAELTHTTSAGTLANAATVAFTGDRGTATISFTAGQTLTSARDAINQDSHKTGITASVSGVTLTLTSVEYGSAADIKLAVSSGAFAVTGGNGDGTANGTDATATINGKSLTGKGNRFSVSDNGLNFAIEFTAGFTGAINDITLSQEDVLNFALTPDASRLDQLAVKGLQPEQLRGLSGSVDQLRSGGSLAGLATNTSQAIRVVDEALERLLLVEGKVDGFANATVASSNSLYTKTVDILDDAISATNDINETEETLLLAKNQTLVQNTIASLTILQQQREGILQLLNSIAYG